MRPQKDSCYWPRAGTFIQNKTSARISWKTFVQQRKRWENHVILTNSSHFQVEWRCSRNLLYLWPPARGNQERWAARKQLATPTSPAAAWPWGSPPTARPYLLCDHCRVACPGRRLPAGRVERALLWAPLERRWRALAPAPWTSLAPSGWVRLRLEIAATTTQNWARSWGCWPNCARWVGRSCTAG